MPIGEPQATRLRMYRKEAEGDVLPWAWANSKLEAALTYWLVIPRRDGTPHPRPIWGVWFDTRLFLSVGSWTHWKAIQARPRVSVHLDASSEVVIVEGHAKVAEERNAITRFVETYNSKYDWNFDAAQLRPPPVVVQPEVILAWTTKGAAGRDGFAATGKWLFT